MALCLGGLRAQSSPEESDPGQAAEVVEEAAEEPEKVVLTEAEAKAVELYKEQMMAIRTWLEEWVHSAHASEASAYRIPVLLSEKLGKVTTEGLPAKISEPFAALKKNIDSQAELNKDLPEDDAEAMEWMANQLTDEKWTARNENLRAEQSELQNNLVYAADACGAGLESDLFQSTELSMYEDRWVVILGTHKKFEDAKAEAMKVAEAIQVHFTLRDMIFDSKGLRYPDDFEDEVFAGQYVQRSNNYWSEGDETMESFISVEMSSGYEGFEPGHYMGVASIAESPEDAAKLVEQVKEHAPGAHVKKALMYFGCSR
jgi:hypothetical protein